MSNAYIHAKGTIIGPNTGTTAAADNRNKKVVLKNCAPFTNYINETNITQVDDAHDIDVIMAIYNLIEYSDNIGKVIAILQR